MRVLLKVIFLALIATCVRAQNTSQSTVVLSWNYDYSKPGNTADHFLVGVLCTSLYSPTGCVKESDGNSYLFAGRINSPAVRNSNLNFGVTFTVAPPWTTTTFFVMGCIPTSPNGNETCAPPALVTGYLHADQVAPNYETPSEPAIGVNLQLISFTKKKD